MLVLSEETHMRKIQTIANNDGDCLRDRILYMHGFDNLLSHKIVKYFGETFSGQFPADMFVKFCFKTRNSSS